MEICSKGHNALKFSSSNFCNFINQLEKLSQPLQEFISIKKTNGTLITKIEKHIYEKETVTRDLKPEFETYGTYFSHYIPKPVTET